MSRSLLILLLACFTAPVFAHHPEPDAIAIPARIDVIGPLGNRLGESYARKYNRPTPLLGKIAYKIAPTSPEAMAWHKAVHRDAYKKNDCGTIDTFFYPKPWEALKVGARTPKKIIRGTVDHTDFDPASTIPTMME